MTEMQKQVSNVFPLGIREALIRAAATPKLSDRIKAIEEVERRARALRPKMFRPDDQPGASIENTRTL